MFGGLSNISVFRHGPMSLNRPLRILTDMMFFKSNKTALFFKLCNAMIILIYYRPLCRNYRGK